MRKNWFLSFGILCTLLPQSGGAYYPEFYKKYQEALWERMPRVETIDQNEKPDKAKKLSAFAENYEYRCAETLYKPEEIGSYFLGFLPRDSDKNLDYQTLQQVTQRLDQCLEHQQGWYMDQIRLNYWGGQMTEKYDEKLGEEAIPRDENTPLLGADFDYLASLRQYLELLHGKEFIAQSVPDLQYKQGDRTRLSSENPQGLFTQGRPLKPSDQPLTQITLQNPGDGFGNGGVIKLQQEVIATIGQVNSTPKAAGQTSTQVFESTLLNAGRNFGQYYSHPMAVLEEVPEANAYPLFDREQYQTTIWKAVQPIVSKILEEDSCEGRIEERVRNKKMTDDTYSDLLGKCETLDPVLFGQELRRQTQYTRMSMALSEAQFLARQHLRSVEQYEQLATYISFLRRTTEKMASKPVYTGFKEGLWRDLLAQLMTFEVQASARSPQETNLGDNYDCEISTFPKMEFLITRAREDLNKIMATQGKTSSSTQNESVSETGDSHSVLYNGALFDEYQLYIRRLKDIHFPAALQEKLDQYYQFVSEMDERFEKLNDQSARDEAFGSLKIHLQVISSLFPSLLLPQEVVNRTLIQDIHELDNFNTAFEDPQFVEALQGEFDMTRLKYCQDKELFKYLGINNPKELEEAFAQRPSTFNEYVNAGERYFESREELIRKERRAPSMGIFNPDTYFDAQRQVSDRSREETDQRGWWDFALGPVQKVTKSIKGFFGFPLSRVENSDAEISQITISMDESAKKAARERRADYKSFLNAWTSFQKKKYEFDQFSLETGALEEVYENALNPMYQDMETIKLHLRKICASQNVSLGCPI